MQPTSHPSSAYFPNPASSPHSLWRLLTSKLFQIFEKSTFSLFICLSLTFHFFLVYFFFKDVRLLGNKCQRGRLPTQRQRNMKDQRNQRNQGIRENTKKNLQINISTNHPFTLSQKNLYIVSQTQYLDQATNRSCRNGSLHFPDLRTGKL